MAEPERFDHTRLHRRGLLVDDVGAEGRTDNGARGGLPLG